MSINPIYTLTCDHCGAYASVDNEIIQFDSPRKIERYLKTHDWMEKPKEHIYICPECRSIKRAEFVRNELRVSHYEGEKNNDAAG